MVCLVFLLLPLLLQAELAFESTAIRVDAELGDTEYRALFPFKNVGSETIKIDHVSSSCGCTVPALKKKTFAPGESGEVEAVFDFGSRVGPQRKVITVKLEGSSELIRLILAVNIPEVVTLIPRVLTWGPDEPLNPKTIRIVVGKGIDATPRIADPIPRQFAVAIEPLEGKPREYRLLVEPKAISGRARERIAIELPKGGAKDERLAEATAFLLATR